MSNWIKTCHPISERLAHVYQHKLVPLTVLKSISKSNVDGSLWIHVSLSRPDRLPSYDELKKVKKEFIGEEKEAYQVFAKESEHVNIHSNCLHLWSPLDGERKVLKLMDIEIEWAESKKERGFGDERTKDISKKNLHG